MTKKQICEKLAVYRGPAKSENSPELCFEQSNSRGSKVREGLAGSKCIAKGAYGYVHVDSLYPTATGARRSSPRSAAGCSRQE
jgi:hypothetical protein